MTKYQEEEDARDRVIQAAMALTASWEMDPEDRLYSQEEVLLAMAVRRLLSLHADRGLRDPGSPGEQATGAEPAHGEDRNDREQS